MTTALVETDYVRLKRSLPQKVVTKNGQTKAVSLFLTEDRKFLKRLSLTLLGCTATLVFLVLTPSQLENPWKIPTFLFLAVLAGIFGKQIALCAHEVGHASAIRGTKPNRRVSIFLGTIMLGVSYTWWVAKHNFHHFAPNRFGVDSDIEFPVIVFDPRQAAERKRIFQPILRHQHIFFIPLLTLQAVNTQFGTIKYLWKRPQDYKWQAAGVTVHWCGIVALMYAMGWGYGFTFLAVMSATQGICNGTVFAPNHKGMPLLENDAPTDRLRDQVLTARNIHANTRIGQMAVDFWFDGLNYQVEHHLFPTMPVDNLRIVAPRVETFCESIGVSYTSVSFFESIKATLGAIRDVADEVRDAHKVLKFHRKEEKRLQKAA